MTKCLVLGCGNNKVPAIQLKDPGAGERRTYSQLYDEVVGVDISPACHPNVVWDLTKTPWPFKDEEFDAVHAYEVMEHLSQAGDVEGFFRIWKEVYRVMKPAGAFCASTPLWNSIYAWCDPGHGIVYSDIMLAYLAQGAYAAQVGRGAMSDYRELWQPPQNLVTVWTNLEDEKKTNFMWILQKQPWEVQ